MSFVFVTGSLGPGRDGIGDYCRVLSQTLAAAGAKPALLALADREETAEHDNFPCLRLPAARPWQERVEAARRFLAAQGAERVFLQLSPYLYHPRGLLQSAAGPLAALLGERRPLVMVHETWVGELPFHGWKDRVIGPWQRHGFLALLRALQSAQLFTSLPLYRAQLARHGVAAALLPLPGNVPVQPEAAQLTLQEPVAGIFGGLWPGFEPHAALDGLAAAGGATLLLIGRHGASSERLAAWRRRHRGLAIVETGPLEPAAVSRHLNRLSFAIGVSPWELAGKSGSIAALLEHGVPVLTTWGDPRQASGVPDDRAPLLQPPGSALAPLLARQPGSGPFRPMAPVVAARLMARP
jgi:hypothetical protein